jgi:5'-nucleotidase
MRKLRILCDQDEVCAHWVNAVLKGHRETHGSKYEREHIKDYWDMEKLEPGGFAFMKTFLDTPGVYLNLEPFEGAIDGLKTIQNEGHEVFIISSVPSGVSFDEKKLWLKKHMPFLPKGSFGSLDRKDIVTGDLLIDDAPHHLEAFAKTNRLAAVFDSPWNVHMETKSVEDFNAHWYLNTVGLSTEDRMVRVKGWQDILKLVRKLAGG